MVKRIEVVPYIEQLYCDKCGAEMKINDSVLMTYPPQYGYTCPSCDNCETSIKCFPSVEYEPKQRIAKTDFYYSNKRRSFHIAKQFIPNSELNNYYKKLCDGCLYHNGKENIDCCYCQDGSHYSDINCMGYSYEIKNQVLD